MSGEIVSKIGKVTVQSGISRREFLKVSGAASALTLSACADSPRQEIFPNVKGAEDQVPGVAVWYRSTCTECTAGCGIEVKTREGRAIKIEGSKDHPVNRGGLCALGHSALQDLYDPDRVRQPLTKDKGAGAAGFKPIDWVAGYEKLATALSEKGKKKYLFSGEYSGALDSLINKWCTQNGVTRVVYESLAPSAEAKAAELVYGVRGIPKYYLDKAKVIVNFGADFLETWVSPCEFARDWAKGRKSSEPTRVFHVEPRLSLTGANADSWLKCAPGTEVLVARALLSSILELGKVSGLSGDALSGARKIADIDIDSVAKSSGVSRAKIVNMASLLVKAPASLVLSGGTGAASDDGVSLHVVTALINLALGNVGKTINLAQVRAVRSSASDFAQAIKELEESKDVALVMFDRSNPAFSSPRGLGLEYAAKRAKLVVSFSPKLDESSSFADLILPTSHALESWGDAEPMAGVRSLIQPAMTAVFNTRSFGDIIVDLLNGMNQTAPLGGKAESFKDYLLSEWRAYYARFGSAAESDFEKFWVKSVELGGHFAKDAPTGGGIPVNPAAFALNFDVPKFGLLGANDGLLLYPFASIKSFDGRSANRPWLQELPDPITKIVWDSWAELHPNTAKRLGLAQEDVVTIRNQYGEISVPVYVTENVHEDIVAVPLGQGHESFGRYAEQVPSANAMQLVSPDVGKRSSVSLLGAKVNLERSRVKTHLVHLDGNKTDEGRDIAKVKYIDSAADLHAHEDHHGSEHHGGGHGDLKQMYDQRTHPLYRWAMAIDLAACTGCSACVVACSAENNVPAVGKDTARRGRHMTWLRIDRYYSQEAEELTVSFMPMMCQHCGNAPCEPVCPIYATYHNEEGLNLMAYNRCVGTRYCANNCSYKVRRFNWKEYETPEPLNWQFNPDVTVRGSGVMEKCNFCVQRIHAARDRAKDLGRPIQDGEILPACVQSCPTEALVFGNLNDPNSRVAKLSADKRGYRVLDHHINTQPAITYLEDIKYRNV